MELYIEVPYVVRLCQADSTRLISYLSINSRLQWSSGNMPYCSAGGPGIESHRRQVCDVTNITTALDTGCTPLLQCLDRLSILPFVGW